MNKTQIQALIDAKIAGQGNQVDSGGALATILKELNDGVAAVPEQISQAKVEVEAEIPSFFEVTGVPNAGGPSVEALDSAGFTKANIAAAAEGKVLYIKMGYQHFAILQAYVYEGGYAIEFLWKRTSDIIATQISVQTLGPLTNTNVIDISFNHILYLNYTPTAGMTKEQIISLGFNEENMYRLVSGQITTVLLGGGQYPIQKAEYVGNTGQSTVVFGDLTYDATNSKWVGTQYTIITQENPAATWSVAVDTLS